MGLTVLGAASQPVNVWGQNQPVSNEALLKRIEELEQQVKILSRKGELGEEAAAEKAKTAVAVSAGANGFSIRSADTNFVLKLRGYIQADARFYPDDHSGGTANDTFLLRRVRRSRSEVPPLRTRVGSRSMRPSARGRAPLRAPFAWRTAHRWRAHESP